MRLGEAVTFALPELRAEAESRMTDLVGFQRRIVGTDDRYGNPTVTWAEPVQVRAWMSTPDGAGERATTTGSEVVYRRSCNVRAGTARADTTVDDPTFVVDDQDVTVAGATMLVVRPYDRIVADGITWEIDGPPRPHGPTSDPIYIELSLVWVENN